MIPRDVANQRVLLLGGVVLEGIVETALEEHRRVNEDMVDAALQKGGESANAPFCGLHYAVKQITMRT